VPRAYERLKFQRFTSSKPADVATISRLVFCLNSQLCIDGCGLYRAGGSTVPAAF
jgi:hypothetical protein